MGVEKWLEIALMSTHFFIRRIYPINRDFKIASYYIIKRQKMNICSEGPFAPFPPWIYVCFSIKQSLVYI